MPSVSEVQRRKMAALHAAGKITDEEWEKFKKLKPGPKKTSSKGGTLAAGGGWPVTKNGLPYSIGK